MTPLQTLKYFREWGLVKKHYVDKGIDPKLADAKRHELHLKALGEKKSSKAFTNADLDKVLAVFYAITRPDDLNAQLRQQDQPEQRAAAALARAVELARGVANVGMERIYVRGIAARLFDGDDQIQRMDAERLNQICGVLIRRRKQIEAQKQRATRQAVGALKPPTGGNPF